MMAADLPPDPAPKRPGDCARWYARAYGWRVFPLHGLRDGRCTCDQKDCKSPAKHPRTPRGCLDATTDQAQITTWWQKWPHANVGIATGGGLIVVDIDPRHGGDDTLVDLCKALGELPDTVEVKTGSNGRHLYLAIPRHDPHTGEVQAAPVEVRNSAGALGPGVDVRGEGGYVVAPPSVHLSGRAYTWEATSRPDEVPLAELPLPWLRAMVARPRLRSIPGGKGDAFPEGERNDSLYRRGCSMRAVGFSPAVIEQALLTENEERCVPPLDPAEVKAIAQSVARHPEGHSAEVKARRKAKAEASPAPGVASPDSAGASAPAPEKPAVLEAPEVFERADSIEIAERLLRDLRAGSGHPIVADRGALWRYDDPRGVFVRLVGSDVYRVAGSYAGLPRRTKDGVKGLALSDAAINAAINAAENLAAVEGFFNLAPRGVCFANAWITAREGRVVVEPHTPEHRAQHALPVVYDEEATCDGWIGMLTEILRREATDDDGKVTGTDPKETERAIELLKEFAGAALLGMATTHAVCLVLVGSGNDGKSRVLNVLRALFPPTAVCSVAPHLWARGFLLAELAGKRLNVVGELPDGDMQDSERFKLVVAGDAVTAERKYGDPFTLVPEAAHIFACNDLPGTRDQSPGFWRRFSVIPCTRAFTATEEVKDIDKRVLATDLSGIASWAINGAAQLQRAGRYTTPSTSEAAKVDWQQTSDQVRQWVDIGCVRLESGAPVYLEATLEKLYAEYRPWALATGHSPLSSTRLGSRLKSLGYLHRTTSARRYRLRLKGTGKGGGADE